ncbi:MAG: hypothetical protein DDT42_01671 [candidate division WS2 bacterium]|uniref:Uncharacterized protein n=1 Tax=Psychracetigena formicireducens TaxID=2986056 RepID=A0A9E2BMP0_PSYF1|nr:hypothetical protein [Candidatus Psychracetigena formicireducens]
MEKKSDTIVFCDTQNTIIDEEYAEKLRQECRKQLGWKVEKGTKIYNELTEFSKGYSVEKRNVAEVFVIFSLARGLTGIKSGADGETKKA